MIIRKPILVPEKHDPTVDCPYGYIYLTLDKHNNKLYVGKKEKPEFDTTYFGSGTLLLRAYKKYPEYFSCKPIDWASSLEELNEKERWWIAYFNAVNSSEFYNILSGGDGGKQPPEVIDKIRQAHIGKMMGENNPNFQGKSMTPEHHRQHSEFMKGKRMSPKTEFTSENSSGGNNSQAKPIVRLNLDGKLLETYSYLSEVKKDPRFPSDEIVRKCCKHKKQSYKGYRWMYLSEYKKLKGGG